MVETFKGLVQRFVEEVGNSIEKKGFSLSDIIEHNISKRAADIIYSGTVRAEMERIELFLSQIAEKYFGKNYRVNAVRQEQVCFYQVNVQLH